MAQTEDKPQSQPHFMTKNMWRARMLESRLEGVAQLGPDKISQLNRDLCKNLSFVWKEAGGLGDQNNKPLWAGYRSFNWEADPQFAVLDSSPYLRWSYPRVSGVELEFYIPPAENALWHKSSWGIWEPDVHGAEKINLEKCVGVLVPGVAFDRFGQRLGHGKGFYDRALASYPGLKVGVGFSMQLIAGALPVEAFDVAMDLIVTDKEIIRVPKKVSSELKEN